MPKRAPGTVTRLPGRTPAANRPAAPTHVLGHSNLPATQAAHDALAAAEDTVAVAEAHLREALAAAPRVNPGLAAAERAVDRARNRAHRAAQHVHKRRITVLDAEGDLDAARARLDEAQSKGAGGDLVTARVEVDKRARRVEASRSELLDAESVQATAEGRLAGAEDHLRSAGALMPPEPASVVLARAALAKAERDYASASDALAEAERAESGDTAPAPEFASVDAFVEDYILPNWRHRLVGDARWCARWWCHAEAITRLEALWEGFEVMRREPAPALSIWWRDQLDPHMRALTDPAGTFAGCTATKYDQVHQQQDSWPVEPAPGGLFHTDPDSPRQPRRVTNPPAKEASADEPA